MEREFFIHFKAWSYSAVPGPRVGLGSPLFTEKNARGSYLKVVWGEGGGGEGVRLKAGLAEPV